MGCVNESIMFGAESQQINEGFYGPNSIKILENHIWQIKFALQKNYDKENIIKELD
jgi:hypothetical protein